MNLHTIQKPKNNEVDLYNLIEAVEDSVLPEEKELVPIIVKDLLESGRVKVYCTYKDCTQFLN